MRPAPPVGFRCRVDGGLQWGFALLAGWSAATLLYWLGATVDAPLAACLAGSALAAALAFVLAWRYPPMAAGELRWDTQTWRLDGAAGSPRIHFDLQRWMLVCFRPRDGGRSAWLALSAGQGNAAWHAMRAALYSRPPSAGASGAATPAPPGTGQAHRSSS